MQSDAARARRVYSMPEHQAALMHLRRVLDDGGTVARAAAELRIPKHTLYTWRDVAEGRRRRKRPEAPMRSGFKAVTVIPPAAVAPAAAPAIVVHGPRGLRVEGLSVDGIAALLRALD
jgi:transposase